MDWDPEDHELPDEGRDQEEQAKAWYDEPTRALNRQLVEENLRLKRLLRESGISWNSRLTLDPNDPRKYTWSSPPRKRTRRSCGTVPLSQDNCHLPVLPTELQLQILEYALTSRYPIIDPLSKTNKEVLTAVEKKRANQIAIGFLATCRAYLVEGTRFLWRNNTFVFTSPATVRDFAYLSLEHRKNIKVVTLRVIARYYDDEDRHLHAPYPSMVGTFTREIRLKTIPRLKEQSLSPKGFRSYTWDQVIDFLEALRPPYDPNHPKGQPRPRLLPGMTCLKMDFVNFPDTFLSPGNRSSLHNVAAHDLGCTLDELQLTGVPFCEWGDAMGDELAGMIKDDGLQLTSDAKFVFSGGQLRSIKGDNWEPAWFPKVIRSWKVLAEEYAQSQGENKKSSTSQSSAHRHPHAENYKMPPAPKEEGHPESMWKKRRTIFKRAPESQESEERVWMEFDRFTGRSLESEKYNPAKDSYDPLVYVCPSCDVMHPPDAH